MADGTTMKNFIERNHRLLAVIGAIIVLLIISGGLIFGPFNGILPEPLRVKLGYDNATGDEDGQITIRLIVDFSGFKENVNETVVFMANQSTNAYSILLEANLTVKINENFVYGVFIEAIEGIEQDEAHYWWYLADDQDGQVAADKFDLRTNQTEVIRWIYKSY